MRFCFYESSRVHQECESSGWHLLFCLQVYVQLFYFNPFLLATTLVVLNPLVCSNLIPILRQLAGLRIHQSRKPKQSHSRQVQWTHLSEPHEAGRPQIVSHPWNFKKYMRMHVCAWNRPRIAFVGTSFIFAEWRNQDLESCLFCYHAGWHMGILEMFMLVFQRCNALTS